MAVERGLPAVPRGLSREMTAYLSSLHNVILSMTGLGRGTTQTRAMRVSERHDYAGGSGQQGFGKLPAASVQTTHLADKAVTAEKLADGSVTEKKLAPGSVTSTALAPDGVDTAAIKNNAVITEKLQDKCVTPEKLADELWPVFLEGSAAHGETVNLGQWQARPLVVMTGHRIPVGICGEIYAGIRNLRKENGQWLFEAEAVCELGNEDGEACYPGEILWLALGRRASNERT